MHSKKYIPVYFFLFVCLFGCSSKANLRILSKDYRNAEEQIALDKKKIEALRKDVQRLEVENSQCQIVRTDLDAVNKTLQQAVQEKNTIISVQRRVIKLLDDPKQTLQKSIAEELARKNIADDGATPAPAR